MGSINGPFSELSQADAPPSALLFVADRIKELRDEKPWKFSSMVYQSNNAVQKFTASDAVLTRTQFDLIFLSNGYSGVRYGREAYDALGKWSASELPTLSAITSRAADYFKLDTPDRNALMMASILGSHDTNFPYHNAMHNRKVVLQSMRLAVAAAFLSPHDVTKLLIAACIHDLGHNGKGNTVDGRHTPFLLEKQAYDHARPYLEKSGMAADDLEDIRTLVLATDVSPLGSDDSPVRKLALAPETLPAEMSRLQNNPVLTRLARILCVADIASSACLCPDQSWAESKAVATEYNASKESDAVLASFEMFMKSSETVINALPEAARVYGGNPDMIRRTIGSFAEKQKTQSHYTLVRR